MDIKIKKEKGLKGIRPKYWIYISVGITLITIIIWLAFSDLSSTLKVEEKGLYIAEAKSAKFEDFVRVNGQVMPISLVQLSPEEGGIVREKVVEEGTYVKKGDVIVRLSNSNLELQILNAEAELAEKQNILRNTQISMEQDRLNNRTEKVQLDMEVQRKKRSYEQQRRLFSEKLIAKETYLQAKEDYELAVNRQNLVAQRLKQDSFYRLSQMNQMEDNLSNMQRNVILIRERKEHLNVVSPINGQLTLLDVELGQSINSGQMIGQINDQSNYKVEAEIDEHYIDRIHQGLGATFERGGQTFNMRVRKVFPEVRSGKFKVEFVFTDKHPENIRTGQTYYLNLQLGQSSQATIIPKGAFFGATGGKWIFVIDGNGKKAYRRNIRIGRQNPKYYEVLEGIDPGEKVIINGYEAYENAKTLTIK